MASTRKIGDNRWQIALAAQPDCSIVVEVHMTYEQAEKIQMDEIKRLGHSAMSLPEAILMRLSR